MLTSGEEGCQRKTGQTQNESSDVSPGGLQNLPETDDTWGLEPLSKEPHIPREVPTSARGQANLDKKRLLPRLVPWGGVTCTWPRQACVGSPGSASNTVSKPSGGLVIAPGRPELGGDLGGRVCASGWSRDVSNRLVVLSGSVVELEARRAQTVGGFDLGSLLTHTFCLDGTSARKIKTCQACWRLPLQETCRLFDPLWKPPLAVAHK